MIVCDRHDWDRERHAFHRPCCSPGEHATIRKAVMKIHRDLFTA